MESPSWNQPQLTLSAVRIVHPSTLVLMKVLPWHAACISTRQERKTREASDLTDIRVVLKWLAKNNMMIRFPRTDKKMRKMHLSMLGKLYMNHEELRPLISITTTPGQITAALVLNGCSGNFEDD